jgi:hypothetical protein
MIHNLDPHAAVLRPEGDLEVVVHRSREVRMFERVARGPVDGANQIIPGVIGQVCGGEPIAHGGANPHQLVGVGRPLVVGELDMISVSGVRETVHEAPRPWI